MSKKQIFNLLPIKHINVYNNVITGTRNSGKTTLLLDNAINYAKKHNDDKVYFITNYPYAFTTTLPDNLIITTFKKLPINQYRYGLVPKTKNFAIFIDDLDYMINDIISEAFNLDKSHVKSVQFSVTDEDN